MGLEKSNIINKNSCKSTVAIWFSTYSYIESREWDLIKKYGNPYHPSLGYYKSNNKKILETQLKWIRRAGIDLLIYDCFAGYKKTPKDIGDDQALKLLMSFLKEQKNEAQELRFCIDLETYVDFHTYEELSIAISYLKENIIEHPYYFKYKNNKPLIIIYVNDDIAEIIQNLRIKFPEFEIQPLAGAELFPNYWQYIEKYPQTLRKDWMTVCPGVDSSLEDLYERDMYIKTKNELFGRFVKDPNLSTEFMRKNPAYKIDRKDDGSSYKEQLLRAINNNPDIIFISGWNDWQFGNQIEPAKEYGFKYVDMTADLLGRSDEVKLYR